MKRFCSYALTVFLLLAGSVAAQAPARSVEEEVGALVTKIRGKLSAGQDNAAALAPEIQALDMLRRQHRSQNAAEAARITELLASLHGQILGDLPKAKELCDELKKDFAGQPMALRAEQMYESFEKAARAKAARTALIGQPAPELHFTWATREGLKTLADLKGKVVVLDFWATWCGPCVASFPQVRELTAHYKDADVVVVGVTSLQGSIMGLETARIDTRNDPAKEMALMKDYVRVKDMTWTVAFSEEPVFNEAYGVTGIPHMAIIAPDGTVRHSGMHPAEPHAEKQKKIDALLREFGKKVPGATESKS